MSQKTKLFLNTPDHPTMTRKLAPSQPSVNATMKLVLLSCLVATQAFGQDADLRQALAEAAAIENSIERLAAFDKIASSNGLTKRTESLSGDSGKWVVSRSISPIDDSSSITAILHSENDVPTGIDRAPLSLIVRHKEGDLDIYINFGNFMGSDTIDATLRYDREPAFSEALSISSDKTAGFFRAKLWTIARKFGTSERLVVRATPYNESPVTVEFDLRGFDGILRLINENAVRNQSNKTEDVINYLAANLLDFRLSETAKGFLMDEAREIIDDAPPGINLENLIYAVECLKSPSVMEWLKDAKTLQNLLAERPSERLRTTVVKAKEHLENAPEGVDTKEFEHRIKLAEDRQ